MTTPRLPLAFLEHVFVAEDPVAFPRWSGPLWHGVLGKALRDLHCVMSDTSCPACPLLHGCGYPYLFQRIAPPGSEMMANKPVPVPHVLRPLFQEEVASPGDVVPLGLVLVGDAAARWRHMLAALRRAGQAGLGRRRGRLRLLEVNQVRLDSDMSIALWAEGETPTAEAAAAIPVPIPCPSRARLTLLTPYRPGAARAPFDAARFAMAVVRRVSLLQYFYTGKRLTADFKALKAQAARIETGDPRFRWCRDKRFSARHDDIANTSGWLGECHLQLSGARALWPYLWLGQWLGVGKNASMGFGWYALAGE